MEDLYGVLGLEDITYLAKDSDIKAAYRKLVLQFHPDKLGENVTDAQKQIWLKI